MSFQGWTSLIKIPLYDKMKKEEQTTIFILGMVIILVLWFVSEFFGLGEGYYVCVVWGVLAYMIITKLIVYHTNKKEVKNK